MLQKWKHIINNWINCYVDKTDQDERTVNIKSLLNIISQLRDNFNLDESKSSILEAHTVEEFILEKYPHFKFENGTVVADGENDIYLVASLLLYFVCVNSKDVDLKSAMCSKLSEEDQEYILRFSKSLMESTPITFKDVHTAITDACGREVREVREARDVQELQEVQAVATVSQGSGGSVAETPPALRSLYGEVRRLQAALDAERFDKNYLQEELARTNLRLDKLVKEKEKYKSDVSHLTAQMCAPRGGEEARAAPPAADDAARLARQLDDAELRLVRAQETLDDVLYERDGLKAKLGELKLERDMWVSASQQESARSRQLGEELEAERRQLGALRELLAELRAHQRRNGLDCSQLECDDLDASLHSLPHNLSVCSEVCANVIEVQLSEERAKVDALQQQIMTLQKENEQLHFAIEEDNSSHELIIKEKDSIIDNLEKELKKQTALLESLRKDHEDVTLSWEKYKLETRDMLQEKEQHLISLTEQFSLLRKNYNALEYARDEMNRTIDKLVKEAADSKREFKKEKEKLVKSLTNEATKFAAVVKEKEALHKQLVEEKAAKDSLETEKNIQCEKINVLVAQNNELLNERVILTQQLTEEKSLRQIVEEQKNVLSSQNAALEKALNKQVKSIEKKLANEVAKTKSLLQDKEALKEKLAEVKSAKHSVEKEKKSLVTEKTSLEQNITEMRSAKELLSKQIEELTLKRETLEQQWVNEKALNEVLHEEKMLLLQDLTEEKSSKHEILKEKESLSTQNECLKHDLLTHKKLQEVLLSDKESIMMEKEELTKCLGEEKSARDEMESEKKDLHLKLSELSEQYTSEVNSKQAELDKTAGDVQRLQLKCEDLEELNMQVSNSLSAGLDKLIQDLKKEATAHEVLQELINVETEDVPVAYKCDLLINIANMLTTEVVMRKNLEKALQHENTALENLKEVLVQREKQISKLETDIKNLQKIIDETKNDLATQNENHIKELDSKMREMQIIRNENQSLTNDLNNVKVQLEVKVHSLKEKLVDNENVTDKLKKSYECQIDNLNVMVNKLTNYLKDKTTEFETVKKEKDKLQHVIEENNKAIKALEDEVKTEKHNQEKLINDFESERQVLKNMVTVTESVMEDQKVTLNNAISEQIKVNEILQEENKGIKEMIQAERNKFELKILEKESAIELVQKELAGLKLEKEEVVKQMNSQKEDMNQEISLLKSEIHARQTEVEKLRDDNNKLEFILQNYKDNFVMFEKKNSELKLNMDSFEVEFRNRVDKLTILLQEQIDEKNNLNIELREKADKISTMEDKLQQLEEQISTLEQEKVNLIKEKDSYVTEINELQKTVQAKSLEDLQRIDKLEKDNAELTDKCDKLEKDNAVFLEQVNELKTRNFALDEERMNLKTGKTQLEEEYSTLKSKFTKSEEAMNKLKAEKIELNEEIEKLNKSNTELTDKCELLQKNNMNLTEEISVLKKCNSELVDKCDKLENNNVELQKQTENFSKDNKVLEEEIKACKTEMAEEISQLKVNVVKLEEEKATLVKESTELTEDFSKLKKENADLADKLNELKKHNTELKEETDRLKICNSESDEVVRKLKGDNSELAEVMGKLKVSNTELEEEIVKLKQANTELVEDLDKSKKHNTELAEEISKMNNDRTDAAAELGKQKNTNSELVEQVVKFEKQNMKLVVEMGELKKDNMKLVDEVCKLTKDNAAYSEEIKVLQKDKAELSEGMRKLHTCNNEITEVINELRNNNTELAEIMDKLKNDNTKLTEEISKLKKEKNELSERIAKVEKENLEFINKLVEKKTVITNLEHTIKENENELKKLREDTANERVTLVHKCDILQDYHSKAEKELEERQKEIATYQKEVATLQAKVELCEEESKAKDGLISKMSKEKDAVISNISKELVEEKMLREKYQKELEEKMASICELKQSLNVINNEREALNILKKENEELIKAVGHRETFAVRSQEITSMHKYSGQAAEQEIRDLHHQVDNTSDLTHSSIESLKTIHDLEKIIHDKNRTITTLQSDVTYLKTLMAESENKVLDVTKELEVSKENCHQLSTQLKKIVHQKNEEIAELKKQVSKMSVTENRATQIIKVSAKYQAIILKRIAEIKSNTVLKELTNFGNSNNCDNELRRSLTAGSITMEDLENFLETTERHLKKCTDKQQALQKERDRLTEVNRINESEIINLKKFLTELSVSFQTFSSVKDLYAQKLSRVVAVQRTVRREVLSLEGHASDAVVLKLERAYAAAMQDLAECAMNLQRWVERSIGRAISSEKIKQAFLHESERTSLAPSTVQNAGLEVQLDELENSFQKLLEEVSRAPRSQGGGGGARDAAGQASTVMEVRAEYEDKLNRMKAKMKQLYTEQIGVFKEKQREEIATLERELARAKDALAESSRAYEAHIRGLTAELWAVGEKFLVQKDEAEWLRRKQRSGSLMSLQHVHSSGLVPAPHEPSRPSDTYSLRSLPVKSNGTKREGRGMHMSDEEGEIFDNRCLTELAATPRRESRAGVPGGPGAPGAGLRLSELRWRNSLCPPHLKSSYPAETQFTQALDEEEIKALGNACAAGVRQQRKEVGITAYKKPGPPTPSKQAGRLSATDSELRESLRVEAEPQPARKTSTPSRIRSLFRSSKTDTTDGTPRSRRLSNIFRKK